MRCAVFGIALLLASSSALAHMELTKTSPADGETVASAPSSVQIWFTQAPDVAVSRMSMEGPSGDVPLKNLHAMEKSLMAMIEGEMVDGAYVVNWQTAGDDGHIQKGEFEFTLKR